VKDEGSPQRLRGPHSVAGGGGVTLGGFAQLGRVSLVYVLISVSKLYQTLNKSTAVGVLRVGGRFVRFIGRRNPGRHSAEFSSAYLAGEGIGHAQCDAAACQAMRIGIGGSPGSGPAHQNTAVFPRLFCGVITEHRNLQCGIVVLREKLAFLGGFWCAGPDVPLRPMNAPN
jgi:hypothetical protein